MRTELEQAAVLIQLQCCYTGLVNKIAKKLKIHKLCDLKDDIRDMKLARAYSRVIHEYYTLPYNYKSGILITILRTDIEAVTIEIVINGTTYSYTGTGTLATIITSLTTTLETAGFQIYNVGLNSFVIYTYDSTFDEPTVTCTNSLSVDEDDVISTTNGITCTTYTATSADVILDDKNCLEREEICGIINHACCLLEKYCEC